MKKGLPIIIFLVLLTMVIYYKIDNNKTYFLPIGDGIALGEQANGKIGNSYNDYIYKYIKKNKKIKFYSKEFCQKDMRINDLKNQIETNKIIKYKNKSLSINQAIFNANIITLSIGATDIFYTLKINNNYLKENDEQKIYNSINKIFIDIEDLIKIIKENYNKELIVVGMYNPLTDENYINQELYDKVFIYHNKKYKKLAKKYNFKYIDTDKIINKNQKYLSNKNSIHINEEGYKTIANHIISKLDFN